MLSFITPVSYTHLDVYKRQYRDYCEEAGWKYVCSKGKIQIFYTEDNLDLIPIHTDEKEKFKQIIKASMRCV